MLDSLRENGDAVRLPSSVGLRRFDRSATRAEDHDGIDVVVESDVGKLFVKVKSSRTGKAALPRK